MWIMPTRGRPHNLRRFIALWRGLAQRRDDVWRIVVDLDDPRLLEYQSIALPFGWNLHIGPRVGTCQSYNGMFKRFPDEPFYGVLADDVVPETEGWDAQLVETAGRDGVAYGDDGINGEALATHSVVGGDFVRKLGFISLPGLVRLYADNVLTELARADGVLRYRGDVKLTHHHTFNGLAPKDATHEKPEAGADAQVYHRWLRHR
jgi:hypothetical protein